MFVGMDVHKESIDVSLAEEWRDGEVRRYGVIPGDLEAVAQVIRALRAPHRRLRFGYEAGPGGFGIHRYLTSQGEDASSSIRRVCRSGAAIGSRPIGAMPVAKPRRPGAHSGRSGGRGATRRRPQPLVSLRVIGQPSIEAAACRVPRQ
jgi:hypothetical protein